MPTILSQGLPLPEELVALPASDLTTPPSLLHRATPLQLHQDQSGGRSDQLQYSSSLAPSTADPQPAAVGRSSPPSPGVHAELAQDGPLALYTPEKQRPIFDVSSSPFHAPGRRRLLETAALLARGGPVSCSAWALWVIG